MQDDLVDEVPSWVCALFAERPPADFEAWWEAVKRLYGPLGVRMDFRAVTRAVIDHGEPQRLSAP